MLTRIHHISNCRSPGQAVSMSKRKGGSDIRQFFGQPQKRKKSKEREGERDCEHGDRTGRVCAGDMEIIPSSRESEFDNERESSQAGENEVQERKGRILDFAQIIQIQTLSNRILYFQEKWFKDHTWLHYSPSVKGVLCFYCAKYFAAQNKLASKQIQRLSRLVLTIGRRHWRDLVCIKTASVTN
ncbi:hypothetical protein F7725_024392 [Dissostichus mawsoni]|uniref:Uncharacterized protein n=1 Tax=Dissostichus mawsoni TaxID=36200 RepID=A0A7J5Y018_DISMA|nr:hypothetical protein F7725_024392 [Dissostichus mawsoni]